MKDLILKWLGIERPQAAYAVPGQTEEKTCEKDGHDWGRVKMWAGLPNRRCQRCQKLENE